MIQLTIGGRYSLHVVPVSSRIRLLNAFATFNIRDVALTAVSEGGIRGWFAGFKPLEVLQRLRGQAMHGINGQSLAEAGFCFFEIATEGMNRCQVIECIGSTARLRKLVERLIQSPLMTNGHGKIDVESWAFGIELDGVAQRSLGINQAVLQVERIAQVVVQFCFVRLELQGQLVVTNSFLMTTLFVGDDSQPVQDFRVAWLLLL